MPDSVPVRLDAQTGQLIVHDRPTLLRIGEVHNSAGVGCYLDEVWPELLALGLNAVVLPVAWEDIEPEEGSFDFSGLDAMLDGARRAGLAVVLNWFGSWKNGESSYVPVWVKADAERFPLARDADGVELPALSVFGAASRDADAAAFGALLGHLGEVDRAAATVVLVQVENEVGLLGAARDHGPLAEAAWLARPAGSGDDEAAAERFMAEHYARYVEVVAAAGKAAYPLPLYTNCWLTGSDAESGLSGGERPGEYPSGGPLPHVFEQWRRHAPSLDLLAPDVYYGEPGAWSARYRAGQPGLFIPELRPDVSGLAEFFLALGCHGALGVAPFGVDHLRPDERERWIRTHAQLRASQDLILDAQRAGRITGVAVGGPGSGLPGELRWEHAGFTFRVYPGAPEHGPGLGLLLADAQGAFWLVGTGMALEAREGGTDRRARLATAEEMATADGQAAGERRLRRRLNGDETANGHHLYVPPVGATGTAPFPDPVPATGLVRFTLHTGWAARDRRPGAEG